jgi:hypothetical protein
LTVGGSTVMPARAASLFLKKPLAFNKKKQAEACFF